jgi:hypothetical protein
LSGAALFESQNGSGHELLGRARDQDFVGGSKIGNAGGDVDSDSADILPNELELACV